MWYKLEQINYPKTRADIISRARENGFSVADNAPICVFIYESVHEPEGGDQISIKTAKEIITMNDDFVLKSDSHDWPEEFEIKDLSMPGNPGTKTTSQDKEKKDEEELDFEFCNGFDYQCRKAYQIAKDHGWHEKPCNDGEVLALIHCEISEALQALRDGNKPDHHCPDFSSLEIELADAIIRIMDYAGERGLNLSLAILEKMKFNKKRPYKHGKNF